MSLPIMCLNFQLLRISLHSLCLIPARSLVLRIFPCLPRCFNLLHDGSCISIWKILWTSLQVSMPHPKHHSSWTSTLLPFLLGFFFIAGRFCINDVAQQCYINALCLRSLLWKYHHIILHFGLFLGTVVTCSSEQVSSLFSCRWLYAIFPTSQMR